MRPTSLKSKTKMVLLMAIILLVAYHLVLFVAAGFGGHGGAFWVSYVFTLLAFGVIALSACKLRTLEIQPRDWMFGYPILRHCYLYAVIQLVLSVLFMILDSTVEISWIIAFVAQVLVAAVACVFIISCFITQEAIQEVNTKVKDSTAFVRLLQVDVEMIVETATDPVVRDAYKTLAEKVRYSDPMSNVNLFELEKQIAQKVNQAYQSLKNNDQAFLLACCREATLMLSERNQKCKALK